MTQNRMKIIVYSDYICPFCHIGFHRLEELKKDFPVEVEVRPFELHPETPKEGLGYDELPFDPAYLEMALENVRQIAAESNIKFNVPSRMPNSHLAMSVAEFAKKKGKFEAYHPLVFEKYWIEDVDIGNLDVLLDLAASVGLEKEEIRAYLKSDEPKRILHQHFVQAQKLGISGVPTFFIGQAVISGAQPYAVFVKAVKSAQAIALS